MTYLVTGANGFLGRSLVERLASHGVKKIRCFLREGGDESALRQVGQDYPDSTIEFFYGTLSSQEDCQKSLKGVSRVYHLAAGLTGAISDMFSNTVVTTKLLLDAIVSENTPIEMVFISSFSIYGVSNMPKGFEIDENAPLEQNPTKRDAYSFVKNFQENLVLDYQKKHDIPTVILRPGVIYGPGGSPISPRVGIKIGSFFLFLGGSNLIPLSYVDNCSEAIVVAGNLVKEGVQIFNVHDNDLPTAKEYLRRYKNQVAKFPTIPVPYFGLTLISKIVKWYHNYSEGQLPDIFTPYKTASMWKGNKFNNSKLRGIGWEPIVSTPEGMDKTFKFEKDKLLSSSR